jgi:hypothetical protein
MIEWLPKMAVNACYGRSARHILEAEFFQRPTWLFVGGFFKVVLLPR